MPLALRRYLWVTDLAFALAAAALCALTAQAFMAGARVPFETTLPTPRHGAPRAVDPLVIGRLFGLEFGEKGTLQQSRPSPEPTRSTLPLRLLGTAVSDAPQGSFASVENHASRTSLVLALGDAVLDATVASIDRLRVTFERAGRLEYLELASPSDARAPVPPTAAKTALVLSSSGDSYLIDSNAAHRLLGNLGTELGGVFFSPERRDGAPAGWRLTRLAQDSPLAALGLVQGDILRGINGFPVGDLSRLLEVAGRLETASRIELELERGGAAMRKVYSLR